MISVTDDNTAVDNTGNFKDDCTTVDLKSSTTTVWSYPYKIILPKYFKKSING